MRQVRRRVKIAALSAHAEKKLDRLLLLVGIVLLIMPSFVGVAMHFRWFGMHLDLARFRDGTLSYLSFWFAGMGGLNAGGAALIPRLPRRNVKRRFVEGAILMFLGACCAVSAMLSGKNVLDFVALLAGICSVTLVIIGFSRIPQSGDGAALRVWIWSAVCLAAIILFVFVLPKGVLDNVNQFGQNSPRLVASTT